VSVGGLAKAASAVTPDCDSAGGFAKAEAVVAAESEVAVAGLAIGGLEKVAAAASGAAVELIVLVGEELSIVMATGGAPRPCDETAAAGAAGAVVSGGWGVANKFAAASSFGF